MLQVLLLLCALGVIRNSQAQDLPPILSFSADDYLGGNQNWSIAQSSNRFIYVANNDGLLEFDGSKWRLYASPNETIIRSVKVVDDLVYTGFYMDFGYWKKTEDGLLQYESLLKKLGLEHIEDEQFWNIIHHYNRILFQSFNRIIIYTLDSEELVIIEDVGTINKMFKYEDKIYFHVLNQGLYTIENENPKLVNDELIFKDSVILNLVTIDGKDVIVTQNNGLLVMNNQSPVRIAKDLKKDLNSISIYTAEQLSSGDIVIGTIANGVFVVSSEGDLIYHFNKTNGLEDNTALSLYEDFSGNVWLGLNNGIDCINIKESYSTYVDKDGTLGTVYESTFFNGLIYLGTNQGLFVKDELSGSKYEMIPGTAGQVWCLRQIDDTLFAGHNSGTFVVSGKEAKLISNVMGTWGVKEVPGNDNLLIQGNFSGLHLLEKKNGSYSYKQPVAGFNISSKHFEFVTENEIIVSHEYKGYYKLFLSEDLSRVERIEQNEIEKGAHSSLVKFNNKVYYAYEEGVFEYDVESDKFLKNVQLSEIFEKNTFISGKMVADDKFLWLFTENHLVRVSVEPLSNDFAIVQIPVVQSLRRSLKGYENISKLGNQEYLIGSSSGYVKINSEELNETDYEILITEIIQYNTNVKDVKRMNLDAEGSFKANQNFIEFHYTVAEYSKFLDTKYQYQLSHRQDDSWSTWSSSSSVSFENLRHGDYQFKVRAKVGENITENIAEYSFTIGRPWYLSNTAIFLYAIATILLFVLINWVYKRYYRNQQEKLLERSTRDLKLKELENQKQIIELKNENLNKDIEARNRELAISTMSMIKKNNAIGSIKEAIVKIKSANKEDIKPVLSLINKTLSDNEDWEFFEEAFNHADKDFFKKVKNLHPQLTANDLRLCVYLRLNLTSKEIAPLLNISPRSVEIKRYRLRKKIDLDRKISLNDYFIKL